MKKNYTVADMANILHQASELYMASSNIPIDYGTGIKYTAVEVHMLRYIIDHPGKTITDLARDWDKTKAALSQMMKKLELKGLIYKTPAPDSEKKQLFYASDKGLVLNKTHIKYDSRVFAQNINLLKKSCSKEDIETCFNVLEEYNHVRRKKHYRSPGEK